MSNETIYTREADELDGWPVGYLLRDGVRIHVFRFGSADEANAWAEEEV